MDLQAGSVVPASRVGAAVAARPPRALLRRAGTINRASLRTRQARLVPLAGRRGRAHAPTFCSHVWHAMRRAEP